MFHRSYANARGRNKPVLVTVLGLKGWRTIISWWCSIVWYVSCFGCYCTRITWHKGTLKDCLIGVRLSISMFLFTVTSCAISTWNWRRILAYRAGHLENIYRVSKGWSCVAETEDCLMLRNSSHRLRKGSMLGCLVFWLLGESQTLYSKSMEWEFMYMCVPYLNVIPWNFKSSSTTEGHGHAFSVFTTSDVWGWNFFLPWNVKSYLRFCVQ